MSKTRIIKEDRKNKIKKVKEVSAKLQATRQEEHAPKQTQPSTKPEVKEQEAATNSYLASRDEQLQALEEQLTTIYTGEELEKFIKIVKDVKAGKTPSIKSIPYNFGAKPKEPEIDELQEPYQGQEALQALEQPKQVVSSTGKEEQQDTSSSLKQEDSPKETPRLVIKTGKVAERYLKALEESAVKVVKDTTPPKAPSPKLMPLIDTVSKLAQFGGEGTQRQIDEKEAAKSDPIAANLPKAFAAVRADRLKEAAATKTDLEDKKKWLANIAQQHQQADEKIKFQKSSSEKLLIKPPSLKDTPKSHSEGDLKVSLSAESSNTKSVFQFWKALEHNQTLPASSPQLEHKSASKESIGSIGSDDTIISSPKDEPSSFRSSLDSPCSLSDKESFLELAGDISAGEQL